MTYKSMTFVLGIWVVITILYALALGISAGVAFGYDYALAEYKTLARPEARLTVRPRVFVPENLVRPSGNGIMAIEDEFQTRRIETLEEDIDEFTPPTLRLYEPSRQYTQPNSPSTPATKKTKITKIYKMIKERKTWPPEEEENKSLLEMMSLIYTSTNQKPDSTTTKPISRSPKLDSTSPKSDSTTLKPEMTLKKSTTSLWPSSIMRIFKPKSTYLKWRPTKPNTKFFYRTLAASHKRKTIGDSYGPVMEIRTYRTRMHGEYERLPMRIWDAITSATEPTEISDDDNDYRNIMYF